MARLTVENAWVEFPVALRRSGRTQMSQTGGAIDAERGVVTALRDISFELREGDRLGLMGHNGAGKTTMLRLLAGAYPPTRGRLVSVGSVSTLFNSTPGLSMDGTGRENLVTCGLHLGMSRRRIAAKMDEIIDFAELGEYIDLPVRIYSAGMMTRLGFSIATAVEPEILLLDEGLATGDAAFAAKAAGKMNELIARSSILVIASHSEALLTSMCTRCLLLEHGQVVADGPAETLAENYRAGVIAAARSDDKEALKRAYAMAQDLAGRGERPPLELEEQGLRHALTIAPDDIGMWQRYAAILRALNKPIPVDAEARMTLAALQHDPSRRDLAARLRVMLEAGALDAIPDLKAAAERARSAMESVTPEPPTDAASDLIGRRQPPTLPVEEEGLRFALSILPGDVSLWQRYCLVLMDQEKRMPPWEEAWMCLALLQAYPERTENAVRLRELLDEPGGNWRPELRNRMEAAAAPRVVSLAS